MKTVWTEGLDTKMALEMRGDFISSHLVRKRLTKLLEDKIDAKRKFIRKDERYDTPNWDKLVADSLGYERALAEVISLLESPEK